MGREKAPEAKADPNAWMVTFSDLLTLLLTFFVMLISMSSLDQKKLKSAFDSFLTVAGTDVFSGEPTLSSSDPDATLMVLRKALIQNLAMNATTIGSDLFALALDGDSVGSPEQGVDGEDKKPNQPGGVGDNAEGGDTPPAEEGLEIFIDERGLVLRLPSSVTFESGRATLRSDFKTLLRGIAKTINKQKLTASIEGHTDDRPIHTLMFPSNWELSMARASGVARYLADACGVQPDDLAAAGFADRRPLASNKTPTGRQKNRRVEIVLNVKQPSQPPSEPGGDRNQEQINHG